jgi:co-chaperonin GroES (HSP10)
MNYYRVRDGSKVYVEENTSGLVPVEDKVLLIPDMVRDSVGGIYKPDRAIAMEQMAQVRALIISTGGNCYESWDAPIPKDFTRVMVCKYAGIQDILGADGLRYQIITDRDITALITEDVQDEEYLGTRKPLGKAEQGSTEPRERMVFA